MTWLQVVENEYLRAMRANEFSWDVAVYVASGLLTYGADDGALALGVQ